MKVNVISNHAGRGAAGSLYDEGQLMADVLARFGHATELFDPVSGFNGAIPNRETVLVAAQPEKYNPLFEEFAARRPQAQIAWRFSLGQGDLFEDFLELGNISIVHMCIEKAYRLTGLMSRPDSAQILNAERPATMIVVTDPAGASACWHGHVTTVLSQRVEKPRQHDGMGPAFFAAFLGERLKGANLAYSLAVGHHFGAAVAMGLWPVPGASTSE